MAPDARSAPVHGFWLILGSLWAVYVFYIMGTNCEQVRDKYRTGGQYDEDVAVVEVKGLIRDTRTWRAQCGAMRGQGK